MGLVQLTATVDLAACMRRCVECGRPFSDVPGSTRRACPLFERGEGLCGERWTTTAFKHHTAGNGIRSLTDAQLLEVRSLIKQGFADRPIAERYNVWPSTINGIRHGHIYRGDA